jgi:beta-glucosidase
MLIIYKGEIQSSIVFVTFAILNCNIPVPMVMFQPFSFAQLICKTIKMKQTISKLPARLLAVLLFTTFSTADAQTSQPDALIYRKVDSIIKKMNLEEKVKMIHASSSFTSGGVERLGIPELVTSDGPHGVRMEHGRDWRTDNDNVNDSATYLPVGICLASTWNPALGRAYGSVLGSEANARGKDIILGPGINIIRTPLNGRNFEYQSEDPYLVSKLAVEYIKGVQSQGVAACVKHFLANNQETNRSGIDVQMSNRALHEIYLPGFKAAVQDAGVYTIMGAYNKFRGQYCTHNDYLVNKLLKKEFGFRGLVMSDWGAVHNTYEAIWNGTDLEMGTDLGGVPYNKFFLGDTVVNLVKNGIISEHLIDEKVRRILYVMYKINKFGKRAPGALSIKEHFAVARKVAEEGIVLLKNSNNVLPLNKTKLRSVAVIGVNAVRPQSEGGGSSQVRTKYEVTPLAGIKNIVGSGVSVSYSRGYEVTRKGSVNQSLIDSAVDAARNADVVILVGGWTHGYNNYAWTDNDYDAEGIDKPNLQMPFGQNELIEAVVKANPRTVVVLMGGGAIDMNKWINQVPSVLQAWYPGSEGGNALASILFGLVNPSGKLPVTFPQQLEQISSHALGEFPGDSTTIHYKDDIFVGYRYFDTYKLEPLFAFGHGLSYTSFSYSNMSVKQQGNSCIVSLVVTNTGKTAGSETVQLYIKDEISSLPRPEKELKGFQKVFLLPGEKKTLSLTLGRDAFSFYDDIKERWFFEPGNFVIMLGSSSKDIRLQKTSWFK